MLTELKLTNFRCFKDHTVPFKSSTIVVGRNNAGKSTTVEALRLVSIVTERYPNLSFRRPPDDLDLALAEIGVSPSLQNLGIEFKGLFHGYSDPPAQIIATFESGETVTIHLGAEGLMHAVIRDNVGKIVSTKGHAQKTPLPRLYILPQVAPLLREEKILNAEYVRGAMSSNLSPLHFRNQLRLFSNMYEEFCRLAEASWPGLRIKELSQGHGYPGTVLGLFVQDNDFVAEVSWMGHGLQMWLQTMWFLARTPKSSTVILDEPDVYMHPDLQRRLIRLLRRGFTQTIVATHSVEIMSEVDSEQVLIIDRKQKRSRFANSEPAVQQIVDHVGSVHNLQLARLWGARKCLLIEGDDVSILRILHAKVVLDAVSSLDDVPSLSIGGWNGWGYAIGSAMLLKNAAGEAIIPYCLLDSDYRTDEQLSERLEDAKQKHVQLHIWQRKELENYLINASVISRVIASRKTKGPAPSEMMVEAAIAKLVVQMEQEVLENYTESFAAQNRAGGGGQALRRAKKLLDDRKAKQGLAALVSGKILLSQLSAWAKREFGSSFGSIAVAKEFRASEVAGELRDVLRAIDAGKVFSK